MLEGILRRNRTIVISGLAGVTALAGVYVLYVAWGLRSLGMEMTTHHPRPWGGVEFALVYAMWLVMMVAMMVPSAAPTILLFATVNQRHQTTQAPFIPTTVFLIGYLLVWTGFSALATLASWGMHSAALLSPAMAITSPLVGAALLLAAGIYQWSSLKHACLAHCRSPLEFLMTHWRRGKGGALVMGLRHGSYCLGCCWLLMALLFVAGVMNLLWLAILAAFVLVEKIIPWGGLVSRPAGLLLIGWGVWIAAQALLFD